MDLLSLPNEMLASVLKYNKHESLKRVRCLNHRINSIARKNELDRLVIRHLTIGRKFNDSSVFLVEIFPENNRSIKNTTISCYLHDELENESNNTLNEILRKIRKINSVVLDHIVINEELIKSICNYSKLFRNGELIVYYCNMNTSTERLKNFVNILKLNEILLFYCNFKDPVTDQIIINFNPTMSVNLRSKDPFLSISAQSLYGRIYDNKLKLAITDSKSSITFNDMVEFLKKHKNITSDMEFGELCKVPKIFKKVVKILKTELSAKYIKKNCNEVQFRQSNGGKKFGQVKFHVEYE